jgi:2-methylaconitate cis-trans-isomerase PrpF
MVLSKKSIPVAYVRGGTSKALFFHEHDIPAPGPLRDRFLRRVMGSPDPMQIDGMGGGHLVTSKVAIIAPSERGGVDVDYTFAQVSIETDTVGYSGNCGNIMAGVGPFAIDEGLVKTCRPGTSLHPELHARQVRIYNTGTKVTTICHVLVDETSGGALESGDYSIAGCPGTGAPILMDYRNVSVDLRTGRVFDRWELTMRLGRLSVQLLELVPFRQHMPLIMSCWAIGASTSPFATSATLWYLLEQQTWASTGPSVLLVSVLMLVSLREPGSSVARPLNWLECAQVGPRSTRNLPCSRWWP